MLTEKLRDAEQKAGNYDTLEEENASLKQEVSNLQFKIKDYEKNELLHIREIEQLKKEKEKDSATIEKLNIEKREVQETEIDILAVSKHATQYLVGECKFKNKPFRYSEYLDTIAKLSPQKGKKENISKLAKIRYQMYTINLKDKIYVQI